MCARISWAHDAVLGHLARARGVSRSDLVRAAVADWIAKYAKEIQEDTEADPGPEMTLVERAFMEQAMAMKKARIREENRLGKIFRRIRDAVEDADYIRWAEMEDP